VTAKAVKLISKKSSPTRKARAFQRRAAKTKNGPASGTPPPYVRRAERTISGSENNPGGNQARDRLTLHMPASLVDRARNAVYWTPGLTMTELVTSALTEALDRMHKKRGEPFPVRKGSLRIGRPLKAV
jgi:hypothetical protein